METLLFNSFCAHDGFPIFQMSIFFNLLWGFFGFECFSFDCEVLYLISVLEHLSFLLWKFALIFDVYLFLKLFCFWNLTYWSFFVFNIHLFFLRFVDYNFYILFWKELGIFKYAFEVPSEIICETWNMKKKRERVAWNKINLIQKLSF